MSVDNDSQKKYLKSDKASSIRDGTQPVSEANKTEESNITTGTSSLKSLVGYVDSESEEDSNDE